MTRSSRQLAFSLIELLAVLGVVAVLFALTIPAFGPMTERIRLGQSTEILAGELQTARLRVVSKNRPIEVRFFKVPNPVEQSELQYRSVGFFTQQDDGEWQPLQAFFTLPEQLAFHEDLKASTLLDEGRDEILADSDLVAQWGGQEFEYCGFQFRPDGSTSLKGTETYTLTIVHQRDRTRSIGGQGGVSNFATLTLDPVSGAVRIHRP